MKASEAHALFAMLLEAYPNARIGEKTHEIYARMLNDLDADAVSRAVSRLVVRCKWFPTIAEIRAETLKRERRSAGEAWGEVLRAISRVGSYRHPEFDDPLIARCVNALGWKNLCLSENAVADRARFIEMYEQLDERREGLRLLGDVAPPPGELGGERRGEVSNLAQLLGRGDE